MKLTWNRRKVNTELGRRYLCLRLSQKGLSKVSTSPLKLILDNNDNRKWGWNTEIPMNELIAACLKGNLQFSLLTSMFVFMMTSTLAKSSLQTMSSNIVPRCEGGVLLDGNGGGGGGSSSSWIWNEDDLIVLKSTRGLGHFLNNYMNSKHAIKRIDSFHHCGINYTAKQLCEGIPVG